MHALHAHLLHVSICMVRKKKKRQCPATTLDSIQSLAIGTAAWADEGGKTAVERPPCIFCPESETDRLDRAMRLRDGLMRGVYGSGHVLSPYR
jgi:hypothetical protein